MRCEVHHVAHDLDLTRHPDRERVLNARGTWEVIQRIDGHWKMAWFNTAGRRSSRDLGDTRRVPYINDILDYGVALAADEGYVCWSNLDVCLVPETAAVIRHKLSRGPCCHSRRIDVQDATVRRSRNDLTDQRPSMGSDLFAFRPEWWLKHRQEFPEMFIACEAFDFMLRWLMEQDNPDAAIWPPVLYHQEHRSYWAERENRLANPAQRHNRLVARSWCAKRGIQPPF